MILAPSRYLETIRTEGTRLFHSAAKDMKAPVPSCPGWTVTDLVEHLGIVHRHKELIVRTLATEDAGHRDDAPLDPEDLLAWFAEGHDLLLDTLESADPAGAVWTWYPPDQTVSFWIRRMAHETAIHRADAELARGPVTPIDPDIAADGVDEVLGPITAAYTEDPRWEFRPDGRIVELQAAETGRVYRLRIGTGSHGPGWTFGPGDHADVTTRITAPASDLDLWAWGRAPAGVLSVEGDPDLVDLIRSVAAEAT
jgi:uncharacterized protein (TIGR03083 family)